MPMKRFLIQLILVLVLGTPVQVSAAPICRRKDRCGILRHTICRNGVEVCSFFRQGGTCGPCEGDESPPDVYLYWADSANFGKIGRIHLTNSSEDNLVFDSFVCSGAIAVDSASGDVFYGEGGTIYRANADFSNRVPIFGGSSNGIAADSVRGKLYWTDSTVIRRSNLDGTDDNVFSSLQGSLQGIAIDAANKNLYATACEPNHIYRCNMDGDGSDCTIVATTSDCMTSISLDVRANKLYIANRSTTLFRANLDGKSLQPFVTGGNNIRGIAVSPSNGKVYWSDDVVIRMAPSSTSDGSSSATNLFTLSGYPYSLALGR